MRSSFYQGHFCLAPSRAGFQTNIGKTSGNNATTGGRRPHRLPPNSSLREGASQKHLVRLGLYRRVVRTWAALSLHGVDVVLSDHVAQTRRCRRSRSSRVRWGQRSTRPSASGRPPFWPNQLTPTQRTHLGRNTPRCVRRMGVSATLYELLPA